MPLVVPSAPLVLPAPRLPGAPEDLSREAESTSSMYPIEANLFTAPSMSTPKLPGYLGSGRVCR